MESYRNLGGDSGVRGYETGTDFIVVQFSDGWKYTYTSASAGSGNVEHMKGLAQHVQGLNGFINTYVKKRYASKYR